MDTPLWYITRIGTGTVTDIAGPFLTPDEAAAQLAARPTTPTTDPPWRCQNPHHDHHLAHGIDCVPALADLPDGSLTITDDQIADAAWTSDGGGTFTRGPDGRPVYQPPTHPDPHNPQTAGAEATEDDDAAG